MLTVMALIDPRLLIGYNYLKVLININQRLIPRALGMLKAKLIIMEVKTKNF